MLGRALPPKTSVEREKTAPFAANRAGSLLARRVLVAAAMAAAFAMSSGRARADDPNGVTPRDPVARDTHAMAATAGSPSAPAAVPRSAPGAIPGGPPGRRHHLRGDAGPETDGAATASAPASAASPLSGSTPGAPAGSPPGGDDASAQADAPSPVAFGATTSAGASAAAGASAPAPAGAGAPAEAGASAPSASGASAVAEPKAPSLPGVAVRLHERDVFLLRLGRPGATAEERARAASETLERLAADSDPASTETHVEEKEGVAVVFAGKTPVVQLTSADAAAAGDSSLDVHAASVAASVHDALRTERRRKAIAQSVFSFSLAIFSALVAVLLVRKATELVDRSRAWIVAHPERLPAIRVLSIEIVGPSAVRGGLTLGLGFGRILLQIGIAYTWLILVLSLFESTRDYTQRLTGFVLTPISALLGRVGAALPLLVIAAVAALAVVALVRFVALFFGSVARGETRLGWLSPDLAPPTSVLVRFGIVVAALLLAAPLVTGNDNGALSRAGIAVLVAVGLASTPILACAAAGIPLVYGRRLRVGQFAEVGGKTGRVRALSLLEVELEDEHGCALRVPHLSSLLHPTRVLGPTRLVTTEIVVDPKASQAQVRKLMLAAARRAGVNASIELIRLDADGAVYRITAAAVAAPTEIDIAAAAADALAEENIALGRSARIPESA